ncbi:mitogen-activated protein kinase kinase kinase 18-like [Cicer arietinum]|uniref:Mitogen-activated protein kinase kinase kinase 18-like n=1 Tax=Cicer arietinum TaxID=3827 RepID=A0A1S2YL21_CICAR|nr:mitogen-activated protein kinase kinase kinase 18-like [Cicer arietinum]
MKWNRGHTIGQGSTATVSLATLNGKIFAVKSTELSCSQPLKREQRILSSLCYPNPYVVNYKGCDITMENNKLMYNLFMEYMPFDTLSQHGGLLSEQAIVCYTRQIVKGLEHLHSKGLVHCDIKGANILIGEDGAKIGDFGCAKSVSEAVAPIRGTPLFMAPEVARGEEQECPSDIWSLGCTLIEVSNNSTPWPNVGNPISALYHIAYSNEVPKIPSFLSNQAKDFLGKCLRRNPKERFTASQLLNHPFLGELCSNDKQVVDFNSSSPTSILDQGFWNSMEESKSVSLGNWIHTTSFDENSIANRIKRLAGEPCCAWWHDDNENESWITIRGKEGCEVDVFCTCGSEISSTSDELDLQGLAKSNVKYRINGHFCNDHIHICRDASFVGSVSNLNFQPGIVEMLLPSTLDVL